MDRRRIWEIARSQSAIDLGCEPDDFERAEPVIVHSRKAPGARRYLELPFACNLVSYGSNVGSVRNAVKSGFCPAWVEMTLKDGALVDKMNRK